MHILQSVNDDALRREADWEGRYRGGHTAWERGGLSPALHHWLASGVLKPGRVLVPGCGRSHETVELARRGFQVTAVDIAPSAVQAERDAIRAAGISAEVVKADLLTWEPEGAFDAIYEQTCLCALAPSTWQDYAQRLHRWLRPGGRLFALFMQTGYPGGPPLRPGRNAPVVFRSALGMARGPCASPIHRVIRLGYVLRRRPQST
jgi:SAM-dependent methyltransferase